MHESLSDIGSKVNSYRNHKPKNHGRDSEPSKPRVESKVKSQMESKRELSNNGSKIHSSLDKPIDI